MSAIALVVLFASACDTSNIPKSYDDKVKANFIASCIGNVPAIGGTTTSLAANGYCECAYNVFVDNVPYDGADKDNRTNDKGGKKFETFDGSLFLDYENDVQTVARIPDELSDASKKTFNLVKPKLEACPGAKENLGTPGSIPGNPGTTVAPVGPVLPAAPGSTPGSTTSTSV